MDFDPKEAARTASFVQFAYNMYGDGTALLPPPDPGIVNAGFDLTLYLNAEDFEDKKFYGYIAASKANPGRLVMAIRRTEDFSEWLLDFSALPVPFTPAPDAGFVALGFLSIFDTFQIVDKNGAGSSLNDALTRINAATPIQSFTVIGHSLGAALATLTAAQLAMQNPARVKDKLTIYTFASPRVGLLDFVASFDSTVKTSFRVWNTLDIVPEVPTFPFIHVSGRGDGIVQTERQLSTLLITPPCEHVEKLPVVARCREFPAGSRLCRCGCPTGDYRRSDSIREAECASGGRAEAAQSRTRPGVASGLRAAGACHHHGGSRARIMAGRRSAPWH